MLTKQYNNIDANEKELVRRAKAGDKDAFASLAGAYSPRLHAYIYKLVGNHEDADDILQEALHISYTHIKQFRGNSLFRTWLYRVAINLCCRALHRRSLKVFSTAVPAGEDPGAKTYEPRDSRPDARENAIEDETRKKVRAAIGRLPKHFAEVITLKELEGMSYEEISSCLGIRAGTVMSRLYRARLKLARALKSLGLKEAGRHAFR